MRIQLVAAVFFLFGISKGCLKLLAIKTNARKGHFDCTFGHYQLCDEKKTIVRTFVKSDIRLC